MIIHCARPKTRSDATSIIVTPRSRRLPSGASAPPQFVIEAKRAVIVLVANSLR